MRDEQFHAALNSAIKEIHKLSELTGYYNNYVAVAAPSLCVEYLLQYSGLPLGSFVCIIGRKASFKSQLSVELARWLLPYGGYTVLLDTEGGVNPFAQIILGEDNVTLETCVFLEDWQAKLTKFSETFIALHKDGLANVPIAFIVDSLVGAESRSIATKISEDGCAQGLYPVKAKLISSYLEHKNTMLSRYPFILIGTNHVKDMINPMAYRPEEYVPGGAALLYHAHLVLKVKKLRKPEYKGDRYEAAVSITVEKNRLGPEDLTIEVPLYFNQVRTESGFVIKPEWDWHQASIDLLADGVGISPRVRDKFFKRINEVLEVKKRNAGRYGIRYYCEQLGISEDDATTADKVMEALYSNKEILKALRDALMIKQAVMFTSEVSYIQLLHGHTTQ